MISYLWTVNTTKATLCRASPILCFAVIRFMLSQDASDACQHTTPIILRILMAFGNLFREPQFVRSVNYYLPASYAWLPHCLIMELHSSLRPIFQLLSYQGYRKAVAESRPIDAKVFLDPWDSAMATINRLRGNTFSNKLCDFALRPKSYGSYICPLHLKWTIWECEIQLNIFINIF
jgi:hypothetical protein